MMLVLMVITVMIRVVMTSMIEMTVIVILVNLLLFSSFPNSNRMAGSSYGSGYGFNRDAAHSSAEASQSDYRPQQHPGGGAGSYGGQKPINRRFQRNR